MSYQGKFQLLFDQGKRYLVWVSGEFELSEEKWLKSGAKSSYPSLSYGGSTVLVALVRDCSSSFFTLWKESPVFPWGVASVEVSVKEYFMPEHSLA